MNYIIFSSTAPTMPSPAKGTEFTEAIAITEVADLNGKQLQSLSMWIYHSFKSGFLHSFRNHCKLSRM